MKIQKAIIFITLVAVAGAAHAQFSAGVKAGVNRNTFEGAKGAFGYSGGGFASYQVFDIFGVKAEVLYTSYAGHLKSYERDFKPVSTTIELANYNNRVLRFHAIEVPVSVQMSLPFLKKLGPKVYLGGAYTYHFGVFQISDNTYTIRENDVLKPSVFTGVSDNVTSEFKSYNTSVMGGIEFNPDLGIPLVIDFRYAYGLIDLKAVDADEKYGAGTFKSRMISLGLGFRIF